MKVIKVEDKNVIEKHFRKNAGLNLYQLGDLDDFFWKYTRWFALSDEEEIIQIIMIYSGSALPVLIALCDSNHSEMKFLLNRISNELPSKFYSHLTNGIVDALDHSYNNTNHGSYLKMLLDKKDFNFREDNSVRRLEVSEEEMIKNFYAESYPDNWFDKRMLETGKYYGFFSEGMLTGISGIHVYSPKYRIAVLGNITTHPLHRGKSICQKVTSVLCDDLFKTTDIIGLNVSSENTAAIKSYENTGFRVIDKYEEFMFEKK